MKRNRLKGLLAALLAAALVTGTAGCKASENLMQDISSLPVRQEDAPSVKGSAMTEFALGLAQQADTGEKNTLVSPLSVLYALAMTANGAKGQTKQEMESVLGMSTDTLNEYLLRYRGSLPDSEHARLRLANSIWLRDDSQRLSVEPQFLQCNANYYAADIYKAPFDSGTLKEINDWVKDNTDGMIPGILEEIDPYTVMYLINALTFEGDWSKPYEEHQVRTAPFTCADGTEVEADMMYSEETRYLQDENARGFLKTYRGGRFAFAALLPNEGMTPEAYLDSLDAGKLENLLANPQYRSVQAALPKFEAEYTAELSGALKEMGMVQAFDGNRADFTGIDDGLFISMVLHRTFISVGEQGTKAGAATAIAMNDGASLRQEEPVVVTLDRPFVYMLVDTETQLPFFIGTMLDPGA